jgi:hypothetical protein
MYLEATISDARGGASIRYGVANVAILLPGGAVRWFGTRPLRPAGPGYGNNMDDSAERHYTEECQQTQKAQAAA